MSDYKTKANDFFETRAFPILILLLLPPFIAELLYGSTYVQTLILFIPEIGLYGCFSLMTRYIVIKKQLKTTSIILFALAFALSLQLLIRQTSLTPLAVVTSHDIYGRMYNINWIYLIWALGYQSVWGIILPLKLFDFLFPDKRDDPLIGFVGFVTVGMLFLIAAYAEWYSWTQIAYPLYNNTQPYQPAFGIFVFALIIITFLIIFGLINKKNDDKVIKTNESIPSDIIIGATFFVLSLSWFWLLLFAFGAFPTIPIVQPLIFSFIISLVAMVAFIYWSKSVEWNNSTTLSVIISVLLASMLAGFLTTGISDLIDFIIKLLLNIIVVVSLVLFYKTGYVEKEKTDEKKFVKKNEKKVGKRIKIN